MTGSEFKDILLDKGWGPQKFATHIGCTRRHIDRCMAMAGDVPRYLELLARYVPPQTERWQRYQRTVSSRFNDAEPVDEAS